MSNEAQDGYDTVEWAARLPGSDGNVGMFGASYFGYTQWAAARGAPPSLKAIVPAITWSDLRDGVVWRGGALELGLQGFWHLNSLAFDTVLKRVAGAPPAEQFGAIGGLVHEIDHLRPDGYTALPLKQFAPLDRVGMLSSFAEAVEHADDPAYDAPFSIAHAYEQVRVPALNVGGWYDIFAGATPRNFNGLRTAGSTPEARQSKLVIGPWSHVNYSNVIGDLDFGFAAQMALMNVQTDMTGLTQRWFDYWLKGIDNGITAEPPVKLFVMGANVWRDEQEWPLWDPVPGIRRRILAAESLSLGESPLTGRDHEISLLKGRWDSYTYDPADPTPMRGGNVLMHSLYGPGAKDQQAIEARPDVLSYSTAPLAPGLSGARRAAARGPLRDRR